MPAPRTFPTPWSAVEIPGGFRVEDANRLPLAYFYGHDDANADVLTLDEARRMAENYAPVGPGADRGGKKRPQPGWAIGWGLQGKFSVARFRPR
jgi:hypothetical protein